MDGSHTGELSAVAPRTDQTTASDKIRMTCRSAAYWRVTFDNPPLSIVGPPEVRRLQQILDEIETEPKVKVVVFDSQGNRVKKLVTRG
jgi:enoyl-CoA hydratase/carnithine racemase